MDDVQSRAQQFTGKIGIYVARIEQADAIAKHIAFVREHSDFLLALTQQAVIFLPGEHAAGAGDRKAAHEQQRSDREHLHEIAARDTPYHVMR